MDIFEQGVLEQVKGMKQEEMYALLRELSQGRMWVAVMKYNYDRRANALAMLATIDAHKDPTSISRTQGIISGLSDLEQFIAQLNTKKSEDEE